MSTKYPSPLLGYNNNVRHKGKVFHIQTEDSGVKYGHIITHLFMDGGRILKSVKTSYAEYIGNERMTEIVREMMKQQHKAMFIALRDGKFDPIVEGGADASQSTQALAAESPPKPTPSPPPVAAAPAAPPVPVPPPPPRRAVPPPLPQAADDSPQTVRQPGQAEELTLDIDALERAAAAANAASPMLRNASDLPPPPANLFREKTAAGKYRVTPVPPTAAPVTVSGGAAAPPSVPPRPGPPAPPRPPSMAQMPPAPVVGGAAARRATQAAAAAGGERRYAPTRPASIFGQARPQQGKTIFGEDLISDKSLDEVILSYLAEDLDEKK
jgi:hypothetical protein